MRSHPYFILYGLAFSFRVFCALFFHQPGYSDAYYYTDVALNLWKGKGFHEDFIWNYLSRPLPPNITGNPSSVYWLPLTSVLIYAGFVLTGGTSFLASQLFNLLISSALVPLTFYLIKDLLPGPRQEAHGWLGAGLMGFCGLYAPYFSLPDNFAPFALLTLLVQIGIYKFLSLGENQFLKGWSLLGLVGILTGLAYLTRVDGILLLLVAGLSLFANKYLLKRKTVFPFWPALLFLSLVFLLTISPWLWHNLNSTGQLLPGGGIRILFLREYNDFYNLAAPLDLDYYLNKKAPASNWGIGPLILSKLDALFQNLLVIGRGTLFFMAPLFILGFLFKKPGNFNQPGAGNNNGTRELWLGFSTGFLPFTIYTLVLYLSMSLLFTFPGTRGSLFHSSGGLLPFIFALVVVGLDRFIEWLGTISRPRATRSRQKNYSLTLLLAAGLISFGFTLNLAQKWDGDFNTLKQAGNWLRDHSQGGSVIMVPDAPAFYYVNQMPCLVISSDSLATNLELAKQYNARYFLLQPEHAPPFLEQLFTRKQAPGFQLVAEFGETQLYLLN